MNSEIVKNFRLEIKDTLAKGKKNTERQHIFTCRNCNRAISIPAAPNKDIGIDTEQTLSLHLMTCERYQPKESGPATAV